MYTPLGGNETRAFEIGTNGQIYSVDIFMFGVTRPSVVLKSGIQTSAGNGTKANPYVVS